MKLKISFWETLFVKEVKPKMDFEYHSSPFFNII